MNLYQKLQEEDQKYSNKLELWRTRLEASFNKHFSHLNPEYTYSNLKHNPDLTEVINYLNVKDYLNNYDEYGTFEEQDDDNVPFYNVWTIGDVHFTSCSSDYFRTSEKHLWVYPDVTMFPKSKTPNKLQEKLPVNTEFLAPAQMW